MEKELKNITVVTHRFPSVSQTFVALQVAGLVTRGYQVEVISLDLPKDGKPVDLAFAPEQFRKVADRVKIFTTQYNPSRHLTMIALNFLLIFFRNLFQQPAALGRLVLWFLTGKVGVKKFKDLLYDSVVLKNIQDCDLIHCQFADLADRIMLAKKLGFLKSPAPVVFSVRGYDITRKSVVETINWKLLASGCAMAMPVCLHFKTLLQEKGFQEAQVKVVPSPINTNLATAVKKHPANAVTRLLSVGRLTEKKGFDDALEAIHMLHRLPFAFTYDIVGEGELYDLLKQKIADYGLQHKVSLLGKLPTDQTLQLMAACDVLIAPSKAAADGDCEGIPNVIKEAMLLGLQVIATDHSGIGELVKEGETGFLVKEQAPQEIREALVKLLQDQDSWEARRVRAAALVRQEYSPESALEKLSEAYRVALESGTVKSLAGTVAMQQATAS